MTDKSVLMAKEMLEAIASKLGVAADHMWQVMLVQARLEAIQYTVLLSFAWAWCIGVSIAAVKAYLKHRACATDKYEGSFELLTGISAASCLLTVLVTSLCLGDILAGFFNPEYAAMHNIVHMIGALK